MAEVYEAIEKQLPYPSKTTWGLVVAYHLLIATALIVALVVFWMTMKSPSEDLITPGEAAVIVAPFALAYLMAGWGILRWKNWSRILSLVLNWLNVIATVVNVSRLRNNPQGIVGVLVSCLVLWWLSLPAVKLVFRRRSATQ